MDDMERVTGKQYRRYQLFELLRIEVRQLDENLFKADRPTLEHVLRELKKLNKGFPSRKTKYTD